MNGYEAMKAALHCAAELSPSERFVLIALADHVNESGECWPSLTRLANLTGFTTRTIVNVLAQLEGHGLIERSKHIGRSNVYKLILTSERVSLVGPSSERVSLPLVNDVHGTSERVSHKQNSNKPSEQKPEPAAAALPETDPEVGAVFSAYQDNIGSMTPIISELIGASIDELTATWVLAAIKIAAERNVRNWSYIEGILKKWRAQGHMDYPQEPGAATANGNGEAAWQLVMSQIKAGTWTLPKDGPELAAIRRSGGWPRYRESLDRDLPFLKREFLQEYHHGKH